MRTTHTYALLEVSQAAYDEIAAKLRAAGYEHAFLEDGAIDMHGIGLSPAPATAATADTWGIRCPHRSAITDQQCLLDDGHAPDSPTRFHRFAPR